MKQYFVQFIIILLLIPSSIYAENNTTVDVIYNNISSHILDWSDYLDKYISTLLLVDTANREICLSENKLQTSYNDADSFFQNNKYLNDTRDIYVRMRINSDIYSRQSDRLNGKITAQLPFDRCKKQWKIYIEDTSTQNGEVKLTDTSNGGFGIRYYNEEEKYGINGSYSIGLTSNYPYLRARYKFSFKYKSWIIEPIQTFKYSHKYYFEEETNIYFDNYFKEDQFFRILLHKKTASILKGTDYGITFQYYLNLGKNAGLELTQSFFGNTYYNDFYAFDKKYSGINNYVSSVSWRENIWRKWFYYEIKPSINFHKDNDYDATYSLRLSFDIYFGLFH